jgi:DNA-binding NarL/FixJ family response regulator
MDAKDGWSSLTRRQREVAVLAGEGLTINEIANQLVVAPHTVQVHLWLVYRKLGIKAPHKKVQLMITLHEMTDRLARLEAAARLAGWDV